MGYLQDVDRWLTDLLHPFCPDDEEQLRALVRQIQRKVLESYQNGKELGASAAKLDHLEKGLRGAGKRFAGQQRS